MSLINKEGFTQDLREDMLFKNMYNPYNTSVESQINNIVAQIDPKNIIDNLDKALKGMYWDKEANKWVMNDSNKPLVNDECRNYLIGYLTGLLNNNTPMGNLDEKRLSMFMLSNIEAIRKEFVVNLEKFGFVPQGEYYPQGIYYNKGTPDTARMTSVMFMVLQVIFMLYSRALKGSESSKIFKSLNINENPNYVPPPTKKGFLGGLFGGN